jgi:branched-chain amino acid transport system ATP-binding protein
MNQRTILEVENISVYYGPMRALGNVSIKVYEGDIVSIIGANGAGKSTLLQTIIGVNRVSKGRILFLEKDITKKATDRIVASGIFLVPEGRGIFPMMSVWENLMLGACHLKSDINKQMDIVCSIFPILAQRMKMPALMLSGGQQQMLSVARGIMASPKLLMLDEPSLGLGPIIIEGIFEVIKNLNKLGMTILLSEQNAYKALQLGNRGYVFETGNIVLSGDTQQLRQNEGVQQAYLSGKGGR